MELFLCCHYGNCVHTKYAVNSHKSHVRKCISTRWSLSELKRITEYSIYYINAHIAQCLMCSRIKSNFNDLETVIKQKSRKNRTHGPNKWQTIQSSKRTWTSTEFIFPTTISRNVCCFSSCRQWQRVDDLNFLDSSIESNRQTFMNIEYEELSAIS